MPQYDSPNGCAPLLLVPPPALVGAGALPRGGKRDHLWRGVAVAAAVVAVAVVCRHERGSCTGAGALCVGSESRGRVAGRARSREGRDEDSGQRPNSADPACRRRAQQSLRGHVKQKSMGCKGYRRSGHRTRRDFSQDWQAGLEREGYAQARNSGTVRARVRRSELQTTSTASVSDPQPSEESSRRGAPCSSRAQRATAGSS